MVGGPLRIREVKIPDRAHTLAGTHVGPLESNLAPRSGGGNRTGTRLATLVAGDVGDGRVENWTHEHELMLASGKTSQKHTRTVIGDLPDDAARDRRRIPGYL